MQKLPNEWLSQAFLLFDHLFITLGAEISLIWTRTKSASAYWFFLNRYIAFFGNIAVFVFGFNTLPPQVSVAILIHLGSHLTRMFQRLQRFFLLLYHGVWANRRALSSCESYNSFRQALLVISQGLICGKSYFQRLLIQCIKTY